MKTLELLKKLKAAGKTIDEAIADIEKPDAWVPPKDTLVDVSSRVGGVTKRYSSGKLNNDGGLLCYSDGKTSKTSVSTASWENWKPIPDAASCFQWIENTGVMPDAEFVVIELEGGNIMGNTPDSFTWELNASAIKQYFVVRK